MSKVVERFQQRMRERAPTEEEIEDARARKRENDAWNAKRWLEIAMEREYGPFNTKMCPKCQRYKHCYGLMMANCDDCVNERIIREEGRMYTARGIVPVPNK